MQNTIFQIKVFQIYIQPYEQCISSVWKKIDFILL